MLSITPLIGVHVFTNLFSVYAQVDNGEGHTSERCRDQAMLSRSLDKQLCTTSWETWMGVVVLPGRIRMRNRDWVSLAGTGCSSALL